MDVKKLRIEIKNILLRNRKEMFEAPNICQDVADCIMVTIIGNGSGL